MFATADGLSVALPPGFALEESLHSLRATPSPSLERVPVRPNLIIRRRTVAQGAVLETLAGQLCAELAQSVPTLADLETSPFTFADGADGVLLAYRFASMADSVLRQYHALRLDELRLTTLTLTVNDKTLTEADRDGYLRCLASATTHPETKP